MRERIVPGQFMQQLPVRFGSTEKSEEWGGRSSYKEFMGEDGLPAMGTGHAEALGPRDSTDCEKVNANFLNL